MNMPLSSPAQAGAKRHLPGEPGVWVFILGDMMVFALFFCVYLFYRSEDPQTYLAGQAKLNQTFGMLNTLLLLTSSLCVVTAVEAVRAGRTRLAPALFGGAFLCGFGFGVVKFFEYGEKIHAGIGLTTSDFFMYYFVLTGVHFLHVTIGMGVLIFLWSRSRRPMNGPQDLSLIESGASYWHMVDVLWIVLFPLLYLIK